MRLVARGISYAYAPGKPALREVSVRIEAGDILFLLGPNGSGKTTLLECLCGLRRPQRGRVLLGEADLYKLSPRERAREIGYVPQVHRPVFGYSVLEVVLMGRAPYLGTFSAPGREDRRAALRALEVVGLADLVNRPYTELSGGEMRLVLIARGLAQEARFLLLDEPDAHLDPKHQHAVLSLVRGFASQETAALVTSHNPTNALLYARRVALLHEGEILVQGPPEDVLTPSHLREAYGMEFVLLVGENGHRALVPAQGIPSNSPTDRERGVGSANSRTIPESFPVAEKGR